MRLPTGILLSFQLYETYSVMRIYFPQDMSTAVSGLASNYDKAQSHQQGRQQASSTGSFPSPLDLFEDAVSSHLISANAAVFKQCWRGGN